MDSPISERTRSATSAVQPTPRGPPSGKGSTVHCSHLTPSESCFRKGQAEFGSTLHGPVTLLGSNGTSRQFQPDANLTDGGSLGCPYGNGGGETYDFKGPDGSQVEFSQVGSGWQATGELVPVARARGDPLGVGRLIARRAGW